jgi:hypothetical protein
MSNYLIGIGGSGAKCIEAVAHLGAAGVFAHKPHYKCKTIFVDPDKANGSLEKAQATLQAYLNASKIQRGNIDPFSLELTTFKERVWTPLPDDGNRTLSALFNYKDPSEQGRSSAGLMDVLFTPSQITLDLNEGFRGNPSIGSAVFGATVDLAGEEIWQEFYDDLKRDSADSGGASVLLIGSVFGGTGAAGVPTIARLIKNHLDAAQIKNVRLGAIILLPYFSFGEVRGADLQARVQEFLPNTQIALQYYHERRYLDVLQGVYLLGEHVLSAVGLAKIGGKEQRNDAHPTELIAALAALDFFRNPSEAVGCMLAARKAADLITWPDLPGPLDMVLRTRLGQFIRFAYGYVGMVHQPLMQFLRSKNDVNTVWIPTFFPKKSDVDYAQVAVQAEHLKTFCERFLIWVGEIHNSLTRGVELQLAHATRFVDLVGDPPKVQLKASFDKEFRSIVLPPSREGLEFPQIYEGLGDAKPSDTKATAGFGELVNELYRLCGERFK